MIQIGERVRVIVSTSRLESVGWRLAGAGIWNAHSQSISMVGELSI
jgi:hypothetical protein